MAERGSSTKDVFLKFVNDQKEHLNILVVGQRRVGKSSFLNTAMSSITGQYSEKADVGSSESSVSRHLRRFPAEVYMQKATGDTENDFLPQFIDLPGFENECTEEIKFFLEIVFFGVCPEDEQVKEVKKTYKKLSFEDLKKKYGRMEKNSKPRNLKVDRVIFVASAVEELPENLIKAVVEVSRENERVIPLFGVLTHEDKVKQNDNISEKKQEFKSLLQLTDRRFLLCTNYCDDFFRKHQGSNYETHREIDEPVLKFLKDVCHQDFRILKPNVSYFTKPTMIFTAINRHGDQSEPRETGNRHGDLPEPREAGNRHGDLPEPREAGNRHGDLRDLVLLIAFVAGAAFAWFRR